MNLNNASLVSVILSGGSGTRLWPASRECHPKQFMKLADGETLLQKAYGRANAFSSKVLTVTNRDYYFMSCDELQRVGCSGGFLLEPFGRNTAPAIGLAAKMIEVTEGADAVMLVLPADHLISDQVGFASAVSEASMLAMRDYLVTFGIVPTAPETGFGYIECGELLEGYITTAKKVKRFVEKPDLATAINCVSSGKYLWNSGMFCCKVGVLLGELSKYAPEVAEATDACWSAMWPINNSQMVEIPPELFSSVPDISIDYAVMEKSDKVVVVPGEFGWSDIGSWKAVRDLVEPDARYNRALGEAIFVDTTNTFVQSEDRLVATVGINDLMIIDTVDALLVAHSDKSQDVKKVVNQLRSIGHDTFKLHRTTVRPWGTFTILEEAPGFKIKRIEVKPGASLSMQMHHHRSEHWIVVSGIANITNGSNEIVVQANESTYIPAGQKHRLQNLGIVPCVMIEVQCGMYLGEDDIIRFEDMYGR